MGTCLSQEYILGQEAINNSLRQDIAKALEAAKETQNSLASAPKRQEEVEALRLVAAHEREIADLKKLVALRAEVDELKLAIKSDPKLVLSEIKEELNKLQEKVTAIKEIKNVSKQLDDEPIFGSFRSNPEGQFGGHSGWGIVAYKEGAFGQSGSAITITKAGVYNVSVSVHFEGAHRSGTYIMLLVNGTQVLVQEKSEGSPTALHTLLPLEEGDQVDVQLDHSGYSVQYYQPPVFMLDLFLIKN